MHCFHLVYFNPQVNIDCSDRSLIIAPKLPTEIPYYSPLLEVKVTYRHNDLPEFYREFFDNLQMDILDLGYNLLTEAPAIHSTRLRTLTALGFAAFIWTTTRLLCCIRAHLAACRN